MRSWLIDIRDSRQVTQEYISKLSGLSRAAYTNIEQGNRNPHPKTAKKIASVLGFDWTLFYEDAREKE